MSTSRQHPRTFSPLLRGALVVGVVALAGIAWKFLQDSSQPTPSAAEAPASPSAKSIPEDPAPSFDLTRHTFDTGGDERTRELAIVWLDTRAREGQPLAGEEATSLLDTLHAGGHPDWQPGYRQWFYNSAFNALHHSEDPQPLTRLLAKLASGDADPTMRLYALQHIGTQRLNGRLRDSLAADIRALLQKLLGSDLATAGTVIELLAAWDGEGAPNDPGTRKRAAVMAEDRTLPIDVRITALHAAGPESLPAARRLAVDTTQPVLLRKAAIACIGRHGGESDFADLKNLSSESSRLAQAADPALTAIRSRLSNPETPEPVAF